jgi:hypothetical protein
MFILAQLLLKVAVTTAQGVEFTNDKRLEIELTKK